MSSSMNNNSPIQNMPANSGPSECFNNRQSSLSSANATRAQRSVHEQNNSTHRAVRSGGRIGRGRGRGRQGGPSGRPDLNNMNGVTDTQADFADQPASTMESDNLTEPVVQNNTSNGSGGRVRGYKPSNRYSSGKYRQRQGTNQLLEGMSGLDIDLAESIAPSGSSSTGPEIGKGRHATNSRKVNLTHLLNYKFERKNRGNRYQESSRARNNLGPYQRNPSTQYRDPGTIHKFSKQQFLQANCQFVVLDGHDYTVHKIDPDWPIDWAYIEEVRFKQSASTETTCPICLEPPVAAKITRCGHIYCWSCMLHYLSLSDENCRQCPICFEPVYRGDLRSVTSHTYTNHCVDEEIVMRLMIRKKGCVEVEPYGLEGETRLESDDIPGYPSAAGSDHYWSRANLVIVDPQTVITKIVQRERDELMWKLEIERNEPEVCFIEQAIESLRKRIEKIQTESKRDLKVKSQDGSGPERGIPEPDVDSSKSYLFYQCFDGQHIYLNPFSTKILCHEYESLETCPLEIRAKVLQMDWISMSEAWRKRFRYLEHLPLTCEFRLIEIDFEKSNLISPETYKVFEDQIKKREQERERRRREERKREKIIEVEQNRRIYGIQPSLKINLDNIDQFPSVSDERYLGITQPRNQARTDELSSDEDGVVGLDNETQGPSNVQEQSRADSDTEMVRDDPIDVLALSFKEIQMQEEAVASRSGKEPASVWSSKGKSGAKNTGAQSSSYAQLLVDAKTSRKEWTRNGSSMPGPSNNFPSLPQSGISSQRQRLTSGSDDGGEELRSPCLFTLSDFIDTNVVSSANKKRTKHKKT